MPLTLTNQPPYYNITEQTTTLTLTDAQIKTIPTTGYQILPAPGENKIYNIISAILIINKTAVYTGVTDSALYLQSTGSPAIYYSSLGLTASLLGDAGNYIHILQTPNSETGSGTFAGFTTTNNTQLLTTYTNNPILILDYNIGINYGGGNAANTLKIKLNYQTITL